MIGWAVGVNGTDHPDPGNATICSDCGTVLTFTEGMGVRRATHDEIEAALSSQEARRAYEALLKVLADRG